MLELNKINRDTFCISPFAEIRIDSDGTLNFCHAADQSLVGTHDNIFKIRPHNYFHGQTVTVARAHLQNGNALDSCKACYSTEQAGCISFRQRRNLQAAVFSGSDMQQSVIESRFLNDFGINSKPRFYHISFSNLCNMACMMCDPKFSTRLQAMNQNMTEIHTPTVGLQDWTTESIWDDFCQHVLDNNDIVCLHVMGGEPMYHKRFKELVNLLCKKQHTNFHFSVVTNGSIYDPYIVDMLKSFKSVQLEISIEGVDSANDYIRHGHNTKVIISNIKKYLSNKSDNFELIIRTVPHALSVLSYHKLLGFCLDNNLIIDSNPLFRPDYLRSSILPNDIKNTVQDSLKSYIINDTKTSQDINLRNKHRIRDCISNNAKFVISQMNQPMSDLAVNKRRLAKYCESWDKHRRYRIDEYIPGLSNFLRENGYDYQ